MLEPQQGLVGKLQQGPMVLSKLDVGQVHLSPDTYLPQDWRTPQEVHSNPKDSKMHDMTTCRDGKTAYAAVQAYLSVAREGSIFFPTSFGRLAGGEDA